MACVASGIGRLIERGEPGRIRDEETSADTEDLAVCGGMWICAGDSHSNDGYYTWGIWYSDVTNDMYMHVFVLIQI